MTKRFYFLSLPFVFVLCGGNEGCADSANHKEADIVAKPQSIYVNTHPPPVFDWNLERYLMTELYKARNNAVATYSYVRNQYTGKF